MHVNYLAMHKVQMHAGTICKLLHRFTGRTVVAFSVALTQSVTVLGGDKVVFNQVLYDENCDYNRSTGDFIAAANGVYEFNFHLVGLPGGTIWFELWMNDRYVLEFIVQPFSGCHIKVSKGAKIRNRYNQPRIPVCFAGEPMMAQHWILAG